MGADQPVHWIILLVLAGLLFGGYKKLPEMARSAGRSMRVFKTELKGLEDDDQARANAAQSTAYTPPTSPAAQPAAPAQYAPPPQPAAPAQPVAPAQYAAPIEPAASTPAIPAPAAAAPAPAADQPAVTAQSAYVPTEPVSDPTAPPRA